MAGRPARLRERVGDLVVRVIIAIVIRLHGGNVPPTRIVRRRVRSLARRAPGAFHHLVHKRNLAADSLSYVGDHLR